MAKKLNGPVDVYINAWSFQATAIVLNAQPDKHLFYWPMVVNEAFALELFIKCLHRIRRRNVRGHDVHKLFRRLSKADQKTIAKYYDEIVTSHPMYLDFSSLVKFDVESVLLRSRSTFTTIRYWHEGVRPSTDAEGKSSNAGTGSLSDAIRKLILELRPQWKAMAIRVPVRFGDAPPSTIIHQ